MSIFPQDIQRMKHTPAQIRLAKLQQQCRDAKKASDSVQQSPSNTPGLDLATRLQDPTQSSTPVSHRIMSRLQKTRSLDQRATSDAIGAATLNINMQFEYTFRPSGNQSILVSMYEPSIIDCSGPDDIDYPKEHNLPEPKQRSTRNRETLLRQIQKMLKSLLMLRRRVKATW